MGCPFHTMKTCDKMSSACGSHVCPACMLSSTVCSNAYYKGVWSIHISVQLTRKASFGLPPQEAPVMIAENRKLLSSYLHVKLNSHCSLRFDKVFGMFMTKSGKVRRMDLIITPLEEYPFCLLGWTGSKQYLRFLRQHAGNCNMYLNSHRQAHESCLNPHPWAFL